jgi:hypothetical protein
MSSAVSTKQAHQARLLSGSNIRHCHNSNISREERAKKAANIGSNDSPLHAPCRASIPKSDRKIQARRGTTRVMYRIYIKEQD